LLKSTFLISSTIAGLKDIRQKLSSDHAFSVTDAVAIQKTAHTLIMLIESDWI